VPEWEGGGDVGNGNPDDREARGDEEMAPNGSEGAEVEEMVTFRM